MAGEIEFTDLLAAKEVTDLAADDVLAVTDVSDISATPDGTSGGITAANLLKKLLGQLDANANSIVNVLTEIFDEGTAPATPAAGHVEIYAKTDGLMYSMDDTGAETLMSGGAGGADTQITLTDVTVFTTSGTWTKPANCHAVRVIVVGGGGGGGGCPTTSASEHAAGTGGAGGGFSEKYILNASLGATETVTVGAGGAGGAAGSNNGVTGGNSSFGAHCSANGGTFGQGDVARSSSTPRILAGQPGGTATGGDVNARGGQGGEYLLGMVSAKGGEGAHGPWGGGGKSQVRFTVGIDGEAGSGPGAGGSGGCNGTSQGTGRAGGDGDDGIVLVYEYTEVP